MLDRRTVLTGGLVLGVAAACSGKSTPQGTTGSTTSSAGAGRPSSSAKTSPDDGSASPESSGSSGGRANVPAYVPFGSIVPDLPGNDRGVPAAFFHYPKNPASYAAVPVGTGDSVTVMNPIYGTGAPRSRSAWWQNLDDTLKVTINLNGVPGADYLDKMNAVMASGDIPDFMLIDPQSVPLPAMKKFFADLTPHLGGDAVKPYQGLAAIPTLAWKACTVNGTIWGVPQPRVAVGYCLGLSTAAASAVGAGQVSLATGQDLLDLMKELTDKTKSHYAYGQDPYWMMRIVWEMYGVGTGDDSWIESGGKFTSQWEASQTADALNAVQTMWRSGYMHPDSANPNASWFPGGTVAMYVQDFVSFTGIKTSNPSFDLQLVPVPKWDGGGLAVKQLLAPAAGGYYAAFKKASEDRVSEMLRLADYLAAPVGTQEFLAVNYGKPGVSYTLDDGDPILTAAGQADTPSIGCLTYITTGKLAVLYTPGQQEFVQQQHDFASKVMTQTYTNPAVGLYSETRASAAGKTAHTAIYDFLEDILFDRKPVSAWSGAVKAWQKAAGDKIRSEYEAAFAQANGH